MLSVTSVIAAATSIAGARAAFAPIREQLLRCSGHDRGIGSMLRWSKAGDMMRRCRRHVSPSEVMSPLPRPGSRIRRAISVF